jgi:hypothetical protein
MGLRLPFRNLTKLLEHWIQNDDREPKGVKIDESVCPALLMTKNCLRRKSIEQMAIKQ